MAVAVAQAAVESECEVAAACEMVAVAAVDPSPDAVPDAAVLKPEPAEAPVEAPAESATSESAGSPEAAEPESSGAAMFASAYEVARELQIRENQLELQALGLWDGPIVGTQGPAAPEPEPAARPKRVRAEPREGSRKSRRLQRCDPSGMALPDDDENAYGDDDDDDEEAGGASVAERTKVASMERKLARLKALHEEKGTGYKNPTATYEHTWMRVRTMSDKALRRRASVIEKACGEHCIVKLRMFAEVLILAGKTDLALEAQQALDRVLELVKA